MAVKRHISAHITSSSLRITPLNPKFPYKNAGKSALFKNILLILPSEPVQNDARKQRDNVEKEKKREPKIKKKYVYKLKPETKTFDQPLQRQNVSTEVQIRIPVFKNTREYLIFCKHHNGTQQALEAWKENESDTVKRSLLLTL